MSLNDEITLSVDPENTGVSVDMLFTNFQRFENRSTYVGETSSPDKVDTLQFYRTLPKSNGNFKGTAKAAVKRTLGIVVSGVDGVAQLQAPVIGEVSFSIPVGATMAQVKKLCQELVSVLDSDALVNSAIYRQII